MFFVTKRTLTVLIISLVVYSCSRGTEAIELVRKSKQTPQNAALEKAKASMGGGISGSLTELFGRAMLKDQTVEEWTNELSQSENYKNRALKWEAKKAGKGIYLVAFGTKDVGEVKGIWGFYWEANLETKTVRYVNDDKGLSLKYGMDNLRKDAPFVTAPFREAKISIARHRNKFTKAWEEDGIVCSIDLDLLNDTSKSLNKAYVNMSFYLVFPGDKTVEVKEKGPLHRVVSSSHPWRPGEALRIHGESKPIDLVYRDYMPNLAIVDVIVTASDPLDFSFEGAVDRHQMEWPFGKAKD